MQKYIKIEQGTYRNKDQSGRRFPIVKDYQKFAGKPGGFVTVAVTDMSDYEGLDKVRINVGSIGDIRVVNEGEYIRFRDEFRGGVTAEPKETETDEEAISRIEARFEILNEMTEAVAQKKVRAMIVSGPPGIGTVSYTHLRAHETR